MDNVAPVITAFTTSATHCGDTAEGEAVTLAATFTDPGVLDTHLAIVHWGDGSPPQTLTVSEVNGSGSVTGSHVFAQGGFYTATLTLVDDDGGSATASTNAAISGAGLHDGVLQIIGTNRADSLVVTHDRTGQIRVHGNFLANRFRSFVGNAVERIEAYLCGSHDVAQVADNVMIPVLMNGGAGSDVLIGGNGPNVLVGGGGNDYLIGGSGRDLLIGGSGTDLLLGQGGDDLLIAGFTQHDDNSVALLAVMDEWTRTDQTYEQRIDHLTNGGGHKGDVRLNRTTVFDDGTVDLILGGAGRDWFAGKRTGGSPDLFLAANEIVLELGVL